MYRPRVTGIPGPEPRDHGDLIGASLNDTPFFAEHSLGALAGMPLKRDDSFDPAAAKVEHGMNPRCFLTLDTPCLQIRIEAHSNLRSIGSVKIAPFTTGAALVHRC